MRKHALGILLTLTLFLLEEIQLLNSVESQARENISGNLSLAYDSCLDIIESLDSSNKGVYRLIVFADIKSSKFL